MHLNEKDYINDCGLSVSNIKEKLDVYVVAHLFGWWGKMVIIRDLRLVCFLSIFFEFLELTFRYWLPNFNECWWDSLILDVFGCNLLGILVGYYTLKYFNMKRYKWVYTTNTNNSTISNNNSKYKWLLMYCPDLKVHEWKMFSSCWRFLCVLWYICFVNLVDLSNFFNKAVLNIPSEHFLA